LSDDTAGLVGGDDLDDQPTMLVRDIPGIPETRIYSQIEVHVAVVFRPHRHHGAGDRHAGPDNFQA
jgi:hypothetical protein